jgi:hypothetical protein
MDHVMALARFEPSNRRYFPDNQPFRVGFDPDGPWQMVPYRGDRHLHLAVTGVDGWTVESVNPNIAEVERIVQEGGVDQDKNNVFRVGGLHPGRAFVVARGPRRELLAKIEIEVKLRLKRFIKFVFVSDNAGHRTTISEKDTREWTQFINEKVFEPQINVHFEYLGTGKIRINQDLGDRIDFASIGDMPFVKRDDAAGRIWHEITDAGTFNAACFNVFCVWDFVNPSNEGDENVAFVSSKDRITAAEMETSGQNFNMCMFREKVDGDWYHKYVLAHEAGHYLNRMPFHTTRDDQLMTPGTAGTFLGKADAAKMNPTAG